MPSSDDGARAAHYLAYADASFRQAETNEGSARTRHEISARDYLEHARLLRAPDCHTGNCLPERR